MKLNGKESYIGLAYRFGNRDSSPEPLFLIEAEDVHQFMQEKGKCTNICIDFGDWGLRWFTAPEDYENIYVFIGAVNSGTLKITAVNTSDTVSIEDFKKASDGTVSIAGYNIATNEYGYPYLVE